MSGSDEGPGRPAFLALDAGNSSTKAALWTGRWGPVTRLPGAAAPGELAAALGAFRGAGAVGLAAVVPDAPLRAAVREVLSLELRSVSAAGPLPFELAYRTPETLGADRLAAAAAAHALAPDRPVVAVDAGTAVTVDAVDFRDGCAVYRGGAIAPGADLLRWALARGTAALPDVELGEPPALGDSTRTSIEAGLGGMLAGGVAHLVARVAAALSAPPLVVATGGWAPWLAARVDAVDRVEPMLVLDGVRRLLDTGRQ